MQMGKNEMDLIFMPYRKIRPDESDKCERQNYGAFRCLGLEDASVAPKWWLKTTTLFCSQFRGSFYSMRLIKPQPLFPSIYHLISLSTH